jgi:Zn-dependent protease
MDALNIRELILLVPVVLIALTFHEFAHALSANALGDPTPKQMNRLTLNPLAHLDPIGTLLLFIAHFGWAKPVPVNPYFFRKPIRDMGIVAVSGPASNLAQAVVFGAIIRLLAGSGFSGSVFYNFILAFSILAIEINLILCFFNLLPLYPLDGSRILRWVLPEQYHDTVSWLERYGPVILIMIFVFEWVFNIPVFSFVLFLPVRFAAQFITGYNFSELMFLYQSALAGG